MPVDLVSPNRGSSPLLATRFFLPPLPATSVPRPRLMERLQQGLRVPLTLISAPPGFGKSLLINQWIHDQANLKAGWLSLEPSDQDWALFFRYLVAAWQRIFPQAGEAALVEWNASPSMTKEMLLNLLLNDLLAALQEKGTDHALLVLDDYHRIETPAIHEAIAYLVEHLPPRCHLVLLTRADPPLPVARWRSRGQALEVRADDLRFTPPETAAYLNQSMHLRLTEQQLHTLQERTEGWIAGLQIAALALQGISSQGASGEVVEAFVRSFGGSNRFVVDYLVEEVVRQQPEIIQDFLMKTSILERFCADLCEYVVRDNVVRDNVIRDNVIRDSLIRDSDKNPATSSRITDNESRITVPFQHILERLEKANLFLIPLDDHRRWFRYHHLFAGLLLVRLQQNHPEQIPLLYRRAAEWYAQDGQWRDAIRFALQTKDMDFSAALFEQAILKGGLDFLFSGMRPLIEPFPADLVQSRPLLSLAKAVAIFDSSQTEGTQALLRFAEKSILASPPFPGQEDLLGWIYVIQSNVATLLGDLPWMVEASQQVSLWIPNDRVANVEALVQLGNAHYYEGYLNKTDTCWQQALDMSLAEDNTGYILDLLDGLARLCFLKGECNRAETLFQRGLRLLAEHPGRHLRWLGATQRDYSELLRERNRLEEARALMAAALPLCEKWHTVSGYGCALIYMGRVLLASGDIPGANEMLNKADEIRRTHTIYPDLETLAQVTRARLYLEAGEAQQAWQMLETCLQSACCKYEFHREWVLIAQARVLVHTGRMAEALTLLAGRLESAKENGRGRNWLAMCLITALALHASGDRQNATRVLQDGLAYAQAEDFRRIFVDEGERMRALLEEYRVQLPQSPLAVYVAEIIAIFPVQQAPERGHPIAGMYETLSPREAEILRFVCLGLSNQEIANRLVLSVGTVKFHIHHIYGKLGVRDRPQAIAKAGMLGLE